MKSSYYIQESFLNKFLSHYIYVSPHVSWCVAHTSLYAL